MATYSWPTSGGGSGGGGGGGGSGIISINGDTTSAQVIAAGTGVSLSTSSGTTRILNASLPCNFTTTSKAGDYTATTSDSYIGYTSTSSTYTVTLPAAGSCPSGFVLMIKDESGGAQTNNITIAAAGSDRIEGLTTMAITANYGVLRLVQRGSAWIAW